MEETLFCDGGDIVHVMEETCLLHSCDGGDILHVTGTLFMLWRRHPCDGGDIVHVWRRHCSCDGGDIVHVMEDIVHVQETLFM